MKIVVERHAPIKAVLLEGVTAAEPQRYFLLLRKQIVGTEVNLIGDAPVVVVAHIQRVEHGVESDIALVVDTKV